MSGDAHINTWQAAICWDSKFAMKGSHCLEKSAPQRAVIYIHSRLLAPLTDLTLLVNLGKPLRRQPAGQLVASACTGQSMG